MKSLIGIVLLVASTGLFAAWLRWMRTQKGAQAKTEEGAQAFDITVKGVYAPSVLHAKIGTPIILRFTRTESTDCSRFVNFPDFKIRKELPEGETVTIELKPEHPGEYSFSCDMSMYHGTLIVE